MFLPLSKSCLELATAWYLRSSDFKGLPLGNIGVALKCGWPALGEAVLALVEGEKAAVLWEKATINPHINRLGFPEGRIQIEYLRSLKDYPDHACLYPAAEHLRDVVDHAMYHGRPYELEMALGEPQLSFRVFDAHVLETYRNDPRYTYDSSDVSGFISISDEYFESGKVPESDQVLLESFGFAYDDALNRGVAVYLRYLANLSPEHQQIWKARELPVGYKLHPDYYRSSILGEFPERVSIFTAFCKELWLVNRMCTAMERDPLFLKDCGDNAEQRPKKFAFLLRPTLEEYNAFVLLFDKLLSDNISYKFFGSDVSLNEESETGDGRIEVRRKGTIRLLDEWVRKYFKPEEWSVWEEAVASLKEIRHARRKPAHAIDEDRFDSQLIKDQRVLVQKGYNAVRSIRMILENHPAVKSAAIEVPDWLREGRIWTF